MRADGPEQREFEREEQDQRDLDYVEGLNDRADTDHGDRGAPTTQAEALCYFLSKVLP
jgi:hypothetical protein